MSELKITKEPIIGIYRITNPKGQVYIGQSKNIAKRIYTYRLSGGRQQRRLRESFLEYGFENHRVDIVEECNFSDLKERERHYQEVFDCTGLNGLNCILAKTNQYPQKYCEKTLELKRLNGSMFNLGKHLSEETKQKLRDANLGKKLSDETKDKISKSIGGVNHPNYGKKLSAETRLKLSLSKQNVSAYVRKRQSEAKAVIILDLNTGVFYNSIKELSKLFGIPDHIMNYNLKKDTRYVRT